MCTSSVSGLHLVVLKLHDFGGLWSYKRGGLPLEVSLYCKCIGARTLWSVKRGGPSLEGSLKRGTTV